LGNEKSQRHEHCHHELDRYDAEGETTVGGL
jgi:hypothetical protein